MQQQQLPCKQCGCKCFIEEAYTTIDARNRTSRKIQFCSAECCVEHDVLKGKRWDMDAAFDTCYKPWLQKTLKISQEQELEDYREKLEDIYYIALETATSRRKNKKYQDN